VAYLTGFQPVFVAGFVLSCFLRELTLDFVFSRLTFSAYIPHVSLRVLFSWLHYGVNVLRLCAMKVDTGDAIGHDSTARLDRS
jgi:hypothetical protein